MNFRSTINNNKVVQLDVLDATFSVLCLNDTELSCLKLNLDLVQQYASEFNIPLLHKVLEFFDAHNLLIERCNRLPAHLTLK